MFKNNTSNHPQKQNNAKTLKQQTSALGVFSVGNLPTNQKKKSLLHHQSSTAPSTIQ